MYSYDCLLPMHICRSLCQLLWSLGPAGLQAGSGGSNVRGHRRIITSNGCAKHLHSWYVCMGRMRGERPSYQLLSAGIFEVTANPCDPPSLHDKVSWWWWTRGSHFSIQIYVSMSSTFPSTGKDSQAFLWRFLVRLEHIIRRE